MVGFWIAVAAAVLPALAILVYFDKKDVFPEPRKVLLATFGLGVMAAIPVLMVELPVQYALNRMDLWPQTKGILEAFIGAAVPEEGYKFIVILYFASRHKAFDEPMDGIVYGVTASLGFATLENLLYTMGGGLHLALVRAVTAVPAHAFFGAIMGYYVGQARFRPGANRTWMLFNALFWPIMLHGLYDAPLLVVKAVGLPPTEPIGGPFGPVPYFVVSFGIVIIEWIWAVLLTARLHKDQMALLAKMNNEAAAAVTPGTRVLQVGLGSLLLLISQVVFLFVIVAALKGSLGYVPLAMVGAVGGLLPFLLGLSLVLTKRKVRRRTAQPE